MNHVMVDIETTGVNPDRSAIIQIAAWKFDPITQDIDTQFFDRCLSIPKLRFWDEGTRLWWAQQKPEILRDIWDRMEDPKTVLEGFIDWVDPSSAPIFWSKPTHFDYMFISSYLSDYEVVNPFHFRTANDLNTFLRSLHFPGDVPEIDVEFTGDAHNARMDALHQICVLFEHLKITKGSPANEHAA